MDRDEWEIEENINDCIDEEELGLDENELARVAWLAEHPELMDPLIRSIRNRPVKI